MGIRGTRGTRGRCAVLAALAVAAGLNAGLAGCGGPPAPAHGKLTLGQLPAAEASSDHLLQWSELVLAGRCMTDRGFDFAVDAAPPDVEAGADDSPYGRDDVAWAAQHGYGIGDPAAPAGEHADPNHAYVEALSTRRQQEFTAALFGTRDDAVTTKTVDGLTLSTNRTGCLADARRALYGGDLDRWFRLDVWVDDLNQLIVARVHADPGYQQALAAWRECLQAKGFSAADPQSARADVLESYRRLPTEQARDRERAEAVADAECAAQHRLVAIGDQLHRAVTSEVVGDRRNDLDDYRKLRSGAVAQAVQLLADVRAHSNGG